MRADYRAPRRAIKLLISYSLREQCWQERDYVFLVIISLLDDHYCNSIARWWAYLHNSNLGFSGWVFSMFQRALLHLYPRAQLWREFYFLWCYHVAHWRAFCWKPVGPLHIVAVLFFTLITNCPAYNVSARLRAWLCNDTLDHAMNMEPKRNGRERTSCEQNTNLLLAAYFFYCFQIFFYYCFGISWKAIKTIEPEFKIDSLWRYTGWSECTPS